MRDEADKHSPAKAEEGQIEAQQGGNYMADEGTCLTRVQVESEPESRDQGEQLAHHKVHLRETQKVHCEVLKKKIQKATQLSIKLILIETKSIRKVLQISLGL